MSSLRRRGHVTVLPIVLSLVDLDVDSPDDPLTLSRLGSSAGICFSFFYAQSIGKTMKNELSNDFLGKLVVSLSEFKIEIGLFLE